ncbi:MAG TPA: cytochrome c biogenesis protein CcsA [Planctomycetes bacterium]|nr:cytochrome c biogenesis protein CcsA [Planctomycetota bacterium]
MLELPVPEIIIFGAVVVLFLAAAIAGVLQLLDGGEKYKRFLPPLISLSVTLEAVILLIRAVALAAIPLTGLFESMIVLTIVFGLVFLLLRGAIRQVWFGSVMAWIIFAMILMAGTVAKPASEAAEAAASPWAIGHGIAMILAGASIMFATASAFLYLLGRGKLKRKEIIQVLGRVPNIEKLEHMNLFGVRISFTLLTIGLISGLWLASVIGTGIAGWLVDGKVVCIIAAWILLAMTLLLNRMLLLKAEARAYMTIVIFVLLLFAILGVTVLGVTQHNFSR